LRCSAKISFQQNQGGSLNMNFNRTAVASTSGVFNIPVPREQKSLSLGEIVDLFKKAIAEAGLPIPHEIVPDGKLYRFSTSDKEGDSAGWYVLYADGVPSGAFGDWRSGIKESWCSKSRQEMTDQQWQEHRARIEEAKRQAEQERQRRQEEAAARANQIWESATPALGYGLDEESHPYLDRKRVYAHKTRVYHGQLSIGGMNCDGALVIPLHNSAGELRSLEFISPSGEKRFLPGGEKQGCFYTIDEPGPIICVAEGFATAAAVYDSAYYHTVVAFDAGNLEPVAKVIREQHPDSLLVICADDDYIREDNPGVTKAKEAASQVQGVVAIPSFAGLEQRGGDFNDLAQIDRRLVSKQIQAAIAGHSNNHQTGGEKAGQEDSQDSVPSKANAEEDRRTYERLAKLSAGDYDRVREKEAQRLGIRVATLDREVGRIRSDANPETGQALALEDPEPWPEPVSGEAVLTALCQTFKRFTIMPDGSYEAVALWVIHTYAHEAAYVSPILGITSPQKRCGKTTLQTLLAALVNRVVN
jgi:putative DNA primase/helicase